MFLFIADEVEHRSESLWSEEVVPTKTVTRDQRNVSSGPGGSGFWKVSPKWKPCQGFAPDPENRNVYLNMYQIGRHNRYCPPEMWWEKLNLGCWVRYRILDRRFLWMDVLCVGILDLDSVFKTWRNVNLRIWVFIKYTFGKKIDTNINNSISDFFQISQHSHSNFNKFS